MDTGQLKCCSRRDVQSSRLQPSRWSRQILQKNVDHTVAAESHPPDHVVFARGVVHHHLALSRGSHRRGPRHEVLLQTAPADRAHPDASRGQQETGSRAPIGRTSHADQGGKHGRVRCGLGQLVKDGREFLHGAHVTVGTSEGTASRTSIRISAILVSAAGTAGLTPVRRQRCPARSSTPTMPLVVA